MASQRKISGVVRMRMLWVTSAIKSDGAGPDQREKWHLVRDKILREPTVTGTWVMKRMKQNRSFIWSNNKFSDAYCTQVCARCWGKKDEEVHVHSPEGDKRHRFSYHVLTTKLEVSTEDWGKPEEALLTQPGGLRRVYWKQVWDWLAV